MVRLSRGLKLGIAFFLLSGSLAAVQQGVAYANSAAPGASGLPAASSDIYYVAMGDSYSSGEGVPPYYADSNTKTDQCHRSELAYATQIKLPGHTQTLAKEAAGFNFIACSGSETVGITQAAVFNADEGIYKTNAKKGEATYNKAGSTDWGKTQGRPEALQVDQLSKKANVITLTVGGNDIRFADVIKACYLSNCAAQGFTLARDKKLPKGTPSTLRAVEGTVIELLQAHLEATFLAIHAAAPLAYLYVGGYPLLFSYGQSCKTGVRTFSASEVNLLNLWGTSLDNTILNAVTAVSGRMPIFYVNPVPAFSGHGVCGKDPWIYGIKVPTTASFHPNQAGQAEYAKLFAACMADPRPCQH
jgi:hypothetical protein